MQIALTKPYIVPPRKARVAIVTGASGGIGLWTAAGLAKAGAQVVMVCRDRERGEDAKAFVGRRQRIRRTSSLRISRT